MFGSVVEILFKNQNLTINSVSVPLAAHMQIIDLSSSSTYFVALPFVPILQFVYIFINNILDTMVGLQWMFRFVCIIFSVCSSNDMRAKVHTQIHTYVCYHTHMHTNI